MQFQPATKEQSFLKLGLCGPAGSGKTFTALRLAHAIGGRIALLDSEHGSASKYVGEAPDEIPWAFDTLALAEFAPTTYTAAVRLAAREGYDVLIVDSLSHAWNGRGGALEIKDAAGGSSWAAWRKVTPMHDELVDAILSAPLHVIATLRSKMAYVQESDERGNTVIRKVGMEPIQRPGMEYEFDLVVDLDWAHVGTVTKSRCPLAADQVAVKPGPDFIQPVLAWLRDGSPPQGPIYGSPEWAAGVTTPKGARLGELDPQQRAQVWSWLHANGKRERYPELMAALAVLGALGAGTDEEE